MFGRRAIAIARRTAASAVAGIGAVACAPLAHNDGAPAAGGPKDSLGRRLVEEADRVTPPHLSICDLCEGEGDAAAPGMWVNVHVSVFLVGDGTLLESTRTSGRGDRDYGQPLCFQLGDLSAAGAVRALHPAVLNMRGGGRRRVRTCVLDDNWGYRDGEEPRLYVPREVGERDFNQSRVARRHVQADWLMEVVVELKSVSHEPPPPAWLGAFAADALGRAKRAITGLSL
jgi:hypothetical protein